MSKIDELIKKYSSDGIEYKSIGEVFDTVTDYVAAGSFADVAKNVKYIREKEFAQLIRTTDIKSKFRGDNFIYVSKNAFNYLWRVNLDREVIVLPNVGNCGEVYHLLPKNLPHKNNVLGPNAILLRSNTSNNRFLSHLFLEEEFQTKLNKVTSQSGQSKFNKTELKKINIPIPSVSIQEEIVNILDKFTSLQAELEAELEARKTQYVYYRDKLLGFDGKDVEWKTLGEVGTFTRGKRFVRTDMIEEGYPCIHYGEMYTHYNIYAKESKSFISEELAGKLRKANPGDVIIVAAGETIEDIGKGTAWLSDSDVVTHDACFSFKSPLNPKYVSYYLRTRLFHDQIRPHISSGKISAINAKGLGKAKIPVPPIEEQDRIVVILDKFDALVNDISTGLPAEIKARRQQYEYYRGKLLTFS